MITKAQAVALGNGTLKAEIHCTLGQNCERTVGPRGGVRDRIVVVRPSGRCKTWVTRPTEFRLPVKYGLYTSLAITQANAEGFHLAEDCSAQKAQ